MYALRDSPVTHPLTAPVTTVTPPTCARNYGQMSPPWEATVRGITPDTVASAWIKARRAP